MDFDQSLDLEETYYREGFEEGTRDGEKQGLIEGRIYGSELSYERFLALGLLYGKISIWKCKYTNESRIMKHIAKVEELLISVPRTNDETLDGEEYDTIMGLAIGKMKVIASICGETSLVKQGIIMDSPSTEITADLEDGAELAVKLRRGKAKGCGK